MKKEDQKAHMMPPKPASHAGMPNAPQQDVEAQHQDKRQVDVGGQEELVDFVSIAAVR